MLYQQSHDKAAKIAQQVMKRLETDNLSQTPDIYEVWYVYFAGSSAEITRAIDVLHAKKEPITDEICIDLHERFLRNEQEQEELHKASDRISETIDKVADMMRDMHQATSNYNESLEDASTQINASEDLDEIKGMLTKITNETKEVINRNEKLEDQLAQSSRVMDAMQRDLESVQQEALTDSLTGLANRKAFDEQILKIENEVLEEGGTFCILMVDIDHFKAFNDNFGHQTGDQVLRLVARTLTDGTKGRDIPARYGGEEFSIILPETDLEGAKIVGEHLRKALAEKDLINRASGETLGRITMSVGAAEYIQNEGHNSLVERADTALYTAKNNGRNQVALAPSPEIRDLKSEA